MLSNTLFKVAWISIMIIDKEAIFEKIYRKSNIQIGVKMSDFGKNTPWQKHTQRVCTGSTSSGCQQNPCIIFKINLYFLGHGSESIKVFYRL